MVTDVRALDPDTVLAELRQAVAVVCEVPADTLSRETSLDTDLRADSLALVEVVDITESALTPLAAPGFRFDDAQLDAFVTLGDVVDHVLAVDRGLRGGAATSGGAASR